MSNSPWIFTHSNCLINIPGHVYKAAYLAKSTFSSNRGGKKSNILWLMRLFHSPRHRGNVTVTSPFPCRLCDPRHRLPLQLLKPRAGHCAQYILSLPKITHGRKKKRKSHSKPHRPEPLYFIRDSRCERGRIWHFREKPPLPQHPTTKTARSVMGSSQFAPAGPRLTGLSPIQPYLCSHQTRDLPAVFASTADVSLAVRPLQRCLLHWSSASLSLPGHLCIILINQLSLF